MEENYEKKIIVTVKNEEESHLMKMNLAIGIFAAIAKDR